MIGTVRGIFTLAGAGAAGLLIWITTQIGQGTTGGYWAVYGMVAGAGLTMALSQLFGGWTKWGFPRISGGVFLAAFLPVLVVAGWVLLAGQPEANWFQRHITAWSSDLAIDGFVDDLRTYLGVLAFGVGLVFGFTFDTAGPRTVRAPEPVTAETLPPAGPPEPPTVEDGAPVPPADEEAPPAAERVPSAQG